MTETQLNSTCQQTFIKELNLKGDEDNGKQAEKERKDGENKYK